MKLLNKIKRKAKKMYYYHKLNQSIKLATEEDMKNRNVVGNKVNQYRVDVSYWQRKLKTL